MRVPVADGVWELQIRHGALVRGTLKANASDQRDGHTTATLAEWSLDESGVANFAQLVGGVPGSYTGAACAAVASYIRQCSTPDWSAVIFDLWHEDSAIPVSIGDDLVPRQGNDAIVSEGLRWAEANADAEWSIDDVCLTVTEHGSVACVAATGLPWGGAIYLVAQVGEVAKRITAEGSTAATGVQHDARPVLDHTHLKWKIVSVIAWNKRVASPVSCSTRLDADTATPTLRESSTAPPDVNPRHLRRALAWFSWARGSVQLTSVKEIGQSHRRDYVTRERIAFVLSLMVYAFTRLWRLEDFPIYFHGDEAFQVVAARRLIDNGFRNELGVPFPFYFSNGGTWAPLITTYLHVVTTTLFGVSVEIARGTSAIAGVIGGAALAMFARDSLGIRTWWAVPLIVGAVPTWFLHSRTTFETAYCTAGYAVFLWCYGRYVAGSARWVGFAVLAAAFTFYTYTNGQLIIGVSGAMLVVADARHHWAMRRKLGWAFAASALGAVPYVTYAWNAPGAMTDQLWRVSSYLVQDVSVWEKLRQFATHYGVGFDPRYWFFTNPHELARHAMLGYPYVPTWFLPFAALGLATVILGNRRPGYRLVIVALIATPIGASLTVVGITRVLPMVVPLSLLMHIGLDATIEKLGQVMQRLHAFRRARPTVALTDRGRFVTISVGALWLSLALPGAIMMRDAFENGPRWFTDYGLYGQQWGAVQLFKEITARATQHPDNVFFVSSTWANGTDLYLPFFVPDLQDVGRVRMGNIRDLLSARRELSRKMVWVMTADEVELARKSKRFQSIDIEASLPYPNGALGFSLARLEYAANVDEVVAAERAARVALRNGQVVVNGERLMVRHSYLDAGSLADIFDRNPRTLGRFNGGNPATLEWSFPSARKIGTVTLAMTAGNWHVSVAVLRPEGVIDAVETDTDARTDPIVAIDVPEGTVGAIRVLITSRVHTDDAIIHLRDVTWQ
jgi:hypothetical protein